MAQSLSHFLEDMIALLRQRIFSARNTGWLVTRVTSAVCSYLSAILVHPRRRHNLSSVFMTVGDGDTVHLGRSPSAEKHVRIGVGHETALEGIWRGTSLG